MNVSDPKLTHVVIAQPQPTTTSVGPAHIGSQVNPGTVELVKTTTPQLTKVVSLTTPSQITSKASNETASASPIEKLVTMILRLFGLEKEDFDFKTDPTSNPIRRSTNVSILRSVLIYVGAAQEDKVVKTTNPPKVLQTQRLEKESVAERLLTKIEDFLNLSDDEGVFDQLLDKISLPSFTTRNTSADKGNLSFLDKILNNIGVSNKRG